MKRVLALRADRERSIAAQLARANDVAAKAESAHAASIDQERIGFNQLATITQGGASVGEIHSLATVVSALTERTAASSVARSEAEAGVTAAETMLAAATTDRRIVERLRERHDVATRDAESARDRAAMDAIALGRYIVSRADGEERLT